VGEAGGAGAAFNQRRGAAERARKRLRADQAHGVRVRRARRQQCERQRRGTRGAHAGTLGGAAGLAAAPGAVVAALVPEGGDAGGGRVCVSV
jgi:hypothetical protein